MANVSFDTYYQEIWQDRWGKLKESLLKDKIHYHHIKGVNSNYHLDESSHWVASQIKCENNDRVLDLCSAPGGKSLILANKLKGSSTLVCNEYSKNRRIRLKKVLQEFLTNETQKKIITTNYDGRFIYKTTLEPFDTILVDAPCSSEEHVLKQEKYLTEWKYGRIKRLSKQQFQIVLSALHKLTPKGLLLYSTCSINPKENDRVIEKILKKSKYKLEIQTLSGSFGEKTKYGWHILPDTCEGRGPIYACLLIKQ